jgi:hypothetical protein
MDDTTLGYLLLGLAIVFILVVVFAVSARTGPGRGRPTPPRGVHLPNPSWLPVLFSVGAALIAAGLAFKPEGALAQMGLLLPGLAVFVLAAIGWVLAASREWREAERSPGHDAHRGQQPAVRHDPRAGREIGHD